MLCDCVSMFALNLFDFRHPWCGCTCMCTNYMLCVHVDALLPNVCCLCTEYVDFTIVLTTRHHEHEFTCYDLCVVLGCLSKTCWSTGICNAYQTWATLLNYWRWRLHEPRLATWTCHPLPFTMSSSTYLE